ITFDDNAAQSLAQGSPPYSGTFQPEDALAALIGSNPNGQWTLEVADLFTGGNTDFGTLSNWSLTITPGVLSASSNPGNLADQNADGRTLENPSQGNPGDVYAIPQPLNGLPGKLPYSQDTLPLIIPGPHVVQTFVNGNPATPDNLVLNGTVNNI